VGAELQRCVDEQGLEREREENESVVFFLLKRNVGVYRLLSSNSSESGVFFSSELTWYKVH